MRKHLSVLALAARGTVCKVIAVTLLAAVLAGALLWLVPAYEDRVVYANEDGSVTSEYYPIDFKYLPAKTGAAAVCAVGFAALLAVLSLNGCGYGAKPGLTVRRLRIGEDSLCLWWSLYNAVCVLFYWAVMAAVCVAVVKLRIDTVQMPYGSYTPGPQTLLLTVYSGAFLHHLLPLRDAAVWLENLLLTALCAVSAARFSHAQRRGSFSIAPFIALALTVGSFFFRMGSSTTILLCMVTAAALGITMMQFLKGETDDDAKTDFRTVQDA